MAVEVTCPICEGRGAREEESGRSSPCRVCSGEGAVDTDELALRILSLTQALDHAVSTLLSEETPRQQIAAQLEWAMKQEPRSRAPRRSRDEQTPPQRLSIAYDGNDIAAEPISPPTAGP